MNILQRARESGRCPPSLLLAEQSGDAASEAFESGLAKVLDANDLSLSSDAQLVDDFKSLLQMAESVDGVIADVPETRKAVVAYRRCIILAVVGSTPASSQALERILSNGFLSTVKLWLDQILNGAVGGIDLLLHLLTNIIKLPVTKSIVKDSGMGKAIGSIEKHKICVGTPNEATIKEKVRLIKEAWNKSVKALKEKDVAGNKQGTKRELDSSSSPLSPSTKKAKVEDTKKSSFSSLLKKMKPSTASSATSPKEERGSSEKVKASQPPTAETKSGDAMKRSPAPQKKQLKRVKWADHFGDPLSVSKIVEGDASQSSQEETPDAPVSWSDRRRRDRLREKELLAQVKKAKLLDDDDDGGLGMETPAAKMIQPTIRWHQPGQLPERTDVTPAQVSSKEVGTQASRVVSVRPVRYTSDYDVPSNPAPLSDVEQALDMTSQSSRVMSTIPFFVPQQPPAAAPAPAVTAASSNSYIPAPNSLGMTAVTSQPQSGSAAATAETVQSLGLPMFLVGQNVQALQTLSSTPSLLNTYVDSTGMYDQARLMSLVQTLSQNIAPSQQQQPQLGHGGGIGGYQQSSTSSYGPAGGQSYSSGGGYGASSSYGSSSYGGESTKNGGYRGGQSSDEGNLHVSGFGPSTTQADIIQLFSPYVRVDEVVMKGTFCFVNTSDPINAKRAREALNGAHVGGAPIRINVAQRKNRDSAPPSYGSNTGSTYGPSGMVQNNSIRGNRGSGTPMALQGQVDVENVRDDRGNPATKNLFVAGYGPGTSENQVRDLFAQHATIVGIIMKGTFSFVNTSDKLSAIRAREALSGSMLNGGVLRINFAKETGRLGTSFDLTYGANAGGGGGGGPHSHYGRGY